MLVRSAGRLGEGPAGVTMDTAAASTQLIAPPTPTPPRPRQINLANIEPRQVYQLTFIVGSYEIKLITTADDEDGVDHLMTLLLSALMPTWSK